MHLGYRLYVCRSNSNHIVYSTINVRFVNTRWHRRKIHKTIVLNPKYYQRVNINSVEYFSIFFYQQVSTETQFTLSGLPVRQAEWTDLAL